MLRQIDIDKIKRLKDEDTKPLEIASVLNKSPATIYKYLKMIENQSFDDSNISKKIENISSKIKPYKDFISKRIKEGVSNKHKLFGEISSIGYIGSYALLNNYINKENIKIITDNTRFYQRVETDPGEQAQVDWGHFGKIRIDGKTLNLFGFVYVLSFSRIMYVEFVTSQKQRILQNCGIIPKMRGMK